MWVIDYAKTVRDWKMLADAVDQQIEDQQGFVKWWRDNVSVRQGAGGKPGEGAKNADRRSLLSVKRAEELTKIATRVQPKAPPPPPPPPARMVAEVAPELPVAAADKRRCRVS